MIPPVSTHARTLVDSAGTMVTAAGANATTFVTVRRSLDFLVQ